LRAWRWFCIDVTGGSDRNRFEELKALLRGLPDCSTVARIDCHLTGFPCFFPGGPGFCTKELPTHGVMFIANNFGTIEMYETLPSDTREFIPGVTRRTENKTWWDLWHIILPESGVPIEQCFFTNAYLGAIMTNVERAAKGKKTSMVGTLRSTKEYRQACVDALAEQVRIAEPRLVVLLGSHAPRAFARAFPDFRPHVKGNLSEIQRRQPPGGRTLQLPSGRTVRVLVLEHPANPRSDQSKREQGRLLKAAYVADNSPFAVRSTSRRCAERPYFRRD
jgi:hypothetical protein